jgi:tRNA threonylcarbamoyladenosine biosynthesis protein TsaB
MALFLAVHARYKDVQLGLFKDERLIELASDESKKISKNFISLLDGMLKKHALTFSSLAFIAAHQGPAPFTTLRVCLTTVNGFAFATKVPLIGVNGLKELVDQYKRADAITVALLNAFSQEVYYGIDDPFNKDISYGYAPAEAFIKELAQKYQSQVSFVGNGIELYEQNLLQVFGDRARFLSTDIVSLETIAQSALDKWQREETHHQLMPIYLKDYSTPARFAF